MIMTVKKAGGPRSKKNGRTTSSQKTKTLTFRDENEQFPHRHHALNQIETLKERILYIKKGLDILSSRSIWDSPRGKF